MGITTISNCPCCKDKRCVCDEGCGYTVWKREIGGGVFSDWEKTTLAQVCQGCMSCMPEQNIIDQEGCNYPPTDEFGKCCGDCTWDQVGFTRGWVKSSTKCKEDCKCPDGPAGYNCDGYKEEAITVQGESGKRCYKHCVRPDPCCEIKPDDPRAVDVSDEVLTCLDGNCPGYCQYHDVQFKAICCGDCSSSTSSTDSTSSESSKSTSSKSTSSTSSSSTSSSISTSSESSKSTSSESTSSVSSVSSVSISSVSTSSVSSVSTSSVSSASESSSSSGDLCTCGYCIWFKTRTATSWTQGSPTGGQSDFCTSGCACADDPPTGSGANCDGYKTELIPIDTVVCYKCCTASSSSQSSASSESSALCNCGCASICQKDITAKIYSDSGGPGETNCGIGNSAEFNLEYRAGLPPTIPPQTPGLGDWWRGSVTHCGGTWTFVLYCIQYENACEQLTMFAESSPACMGIHGGGPDDHVTENTDCTCDPLNVDLGGFAGTSDGSSGCCCEGCTLSMDVDACQWTAHVNIFDPH